VTIIEHRSKIYPGDLVNLHIHTAVAEVYLKELIALIDRKTGETTGEKPKFLEQDQIAIGRFELSTVGQSICMEPYEYYPQLGRFKLYKDGRTVAVGKILQIIE
jgi:peptide chain release factor subunit 3